MPEVMRIHSVFVELEGDELAYQYMCREGDSTPPLASFRKPIQMKELKALAAGLDEALVACARRQAGETALREWGGKLYDKVIPVELAERLRADSTTSYLVLYLDPMLVWLPWELLFDGDEFLSRRLRVSRQLQKSPSEFRAAEKRLKEPRSGRGALIVFGDITQLHADGEKAEVERALDAVYGSSNIWFYRAKSAIDILGELKKDYEICHFVGHGRYVPEAPDETGWMFADGTVLTCGDIEAVSSRAAFPRLVFANSCDSAHPSYTECGEYVSTLYRAFLKQGVPHYVGTVSPVPDEAAKEFARSFYRLVAQGSSVGEALGEARGVFAERPGVPLWACYVHYGDPTYRLVALSETRAPGYETAHQAWQETLHQKPSFSVLGRLSKEEIHRMLNHYKSMIAKSSEDGEAHYGLALCYLQLGLYDLATKNFKRTLQLMPEYADAYYYYGISLVRGRRPKLLSLSEVRLIERYVETALQLDDRPAKYYYLAAILKFEYYLSNGLICRPPSPDELFFVAEDKEYDPWEVERLLYLIPARDPELISKIRRNQETSKL